MSGVRQELFWINSRYYQPTYAENGKCLKNEKGFISIRNFYCPIFHLNSFSGSTCREGQSYECWVGIKEYTIEQIKGEYWIFPVVVVFAFFFLWTPFHSQREGLKTNGIFNSKSGGIFMLFQFSFQIFKNLKISLESSIF